MKFMRKNIAQFLLFIMTFMLSTTGVFASESSEIQFHAPLAAQEFDIDDELADDLYTYFGSSDLPSFLETLEPGESVTFGQGQLQTTISRGETSHGVNVDGIIAPLTPFSVDRTVPVNWAGRHIFDCRFRMSGLIQGPGNMSVDFYAANISYLGSGINTANITSTYLNGNNTAGANIYITYSYAYLGATTTGANYTFY